MCSNFTPRRPKLEATTFYLIDNWLIKAGLHLQYIFYTKGSIPKDSAQHWNKLNHLHQWHTVQALGNLTTRRPRRQPWKGTQDWIPMWSDKVIKIKVQISGCHRLSCVVKRQWVGASNIHTRPVCGCGDVGKLWAAPTLPAEGYVVLYDILHWAGGGKGLLPSTFLYNYL